MKRVFAFVLALCMSVSMAGCGGRTEGAKEETSGEMGKIAFVCESIGDKSFNDSAWAGIQALGEQGWGTQLIETGDASKADKYKDFILDAIDNGNGYIIASSAYTEDCMAIAKEYTDTKFIIFDDYQEKENIPDNVSVIFYKQNEGSYMVGLLAAAMTKTGTVAIDVGVESPVINDFVTGFIAGVKDWDENVSVVKAAVNSWYDPTKMKEVCLSQNRDSNADVFFPVAGASGDGAYEACVEMGTWAIGVDSDVHALYKDSENPEISDAILTSMLKEVGNSLITLFERIEAGEDVWNQMIIMGTESDSVSYVDNEYFQEQVPEAVRDKMQEAKEKISCGELVVKSYYDFADESEYNAYVEAARK